jgi:hypothetical protein
MRIKETFMEDIELHPSFIEREGKREYAVLPYKEFEKIQSLLEDARDLLGLRRAKAEDDGEHLSLTEVEERLKNKS